MIFNNGYYITYDIEGKPFFLGPYLVLEDAERDYERIENRSHRQIIKVQEMR